MRGGRGIRWTTRGFAYQDINAGVPGRGVAGQPYFAAFGHRAAIQWFGGITKSNYHSLQVAINRPFKNGLMLKGAYTLSKAMNMTDDDGWAGLSWNSPEVLDRNYALAGSSAGTSLNAPGNAQTADLVGPITQLGGIGPGNPYYDPAAWAPVTAVRYGTTGRNSVRGPRSSRLDFSVFRAFQIGRVRPEFRVEAFNLTNTPQFGNPASNVTGGNFMQILSASGERNIRMGLRFSF